MDLAAIQTRNNVEKNRFELEWDGGMAIIDYKIGKSGNWYLIHTEVPKEWEGSGAGHKIVRETLQLLDEQEVKIIPSCPFIRAYIKRNLHQYEHLLADGVKLD